MKTKTMLTRLIAPGLALALGVALLSPTAQATPYATELGYSAGAVSFTLNEAADVVYIIFGSTTTNIGPLAAGSYSTNVGATTPFSVKVQKTSAAGYKVPSAPGVASKLQISTDPVLSRFNSPRGVAVNRNPGSPFFGRIYVANSAVGSAGGRSVGDGLYTLKSDFSDSPNGYGNTARDGTTTGLGLNYTLSANSPFRLTVGQDSYLYIADYSDANGGVYRVDGNLANGQLVLDGVGGPSVPLYNHGSTLKVIAEGSLATSDLKIYTIDEDYPVSLQNDLLRYDIDAGPLPNTSVPTTVSGALYSGASIQQDFTKGGPNNYFYLHQNRAIPATLAALYVVDSGGTTLANSLDLWRTLTGDPAAIDPLTNCWSIALSPDGKWLGMIHAGGVTPSDTWVIPLNNGIPDLGNRLLLDTGTVSQGRAIDFDAAGNLYTVSSGDAVLRSFSPGGYTEATTTSDGTFTLFVPAVDVSMTAATPEASETGPTAGVITVTRSGSTALPLTVSYTAGGTASFLVDNQASVLPTPLGKVTFAPGDSTTNLTILPIDDSIAELSETLTLSVAPSPNYSIGIPGSATVTIADNDTPAIDLEVVQGSMYERLANDYARLRAVRRGDTNAASFSANLTYLGTAASSRYTAPATVTIDPGLVNLSFDITPLNDNLLQGDQTIIANVASGSGYTVGVTSPTATATIVDDELLPETTVLYSENFNTDNSGNWTMRFAAANGLDDYRYQFSYDYTSGLTPVTASTFPVLPPAPHGSGNTLGCYLTVNKDEASDLGAAGINLYPNSQSFSGNYAVRFDMYLMVGDAASTTEYTLFGINHSGNNTNWFRNSITTFSGVSATAWTFDGLFYGVESDGAALGDYVIYSGPTTALNNPTNLSPGVNASTLAGIFKIPPYGGPVGRTIAGAPSCEEGSTTPSWSDVEIDKVGSLVRLMINKTPIMTVTNGTAFTTGNIMLGYCDAYDSIMAGNACVIYDNLRVVRLDDLKITNIQSVGANAEVTFTWGIDDPTSLFKLQSSTVVGSGYVDTAATITKLSPGVYKATIAKSGAAQFYRIRYAP